MKKSEYKEAIKDKLYNLLSNMAFVDELAEGVIEVNKELGMLPPEVTARFVCTNGKRMVTKVNRWEPEAEVE